MGSGFPWDCLAGADAFVMATNSFAVAAYAAMVAGVFM